MKLDSLFVCAENKIFTWAEFGLAVTDQSRGGVTFRQWLANLEVGSRSGRGWPILRWGHVQAVADQS
ncbi:hypothetical protein RRG08_038757 [Elysia crispata]|uniref:Uncharacterized protein n=1 Tax=Elysia crispata TaxID=231223 RepID=A0AAE1AM30_9GAST|nr:hypothetical protein RRG08_038757 [Elysia crispata]